MASVATKFLYGPSCPNHVIDTSKAFGDTAASCVVLRGRSSPTVASITMDAPRASTSSSSGLRQTALRLLVLRYRCIPLASGADTPGANGGM